MADFSIAGQEICASVEPEESLRAGTTVPLSFNFNRMHLFDLETEQALAIH